MNGLPSSIQIPPSGGVSGPGAGGLAGGGAASDPDAAKVSDLIKQAKALIDQATAQEKDPEDGLLLEKIATEMQQVLANEQKLTDQAMGAGPGAKMIRKATSGSTGGY